MSDIFESDCQALVNTTNTKGVMGGGLAAQFKQRYPKMFAAYQLACDDREHKVGEMLFYHDDSGKIIVNFPTKDHWKDPSTIEYIQSGLKDLRRAILTSAECDFLPTITSIAVPPLGCGLGGLDWTDVEPLIIDSLGDLGIRVDIYPPDADKYTLRLGSTSTKETMNMAGKQEREAYYEATGTTRAQRFDYVRQALAANPRTSERAIAKALGISNAAAHHLVHEVRTGRKRVSVSRGLCSDCWEEFPTTQLVNGRCLACR